MKTKERQPRELGYVVGSNGTRYAVMDDTSWRATQQGKALPVTSRSLDTIYQDFVDFPDYPGRKQLLDLAERVRGKVVWHDLYPTPPGTVV